MGLDSPSPGTYNVSEDLTKVRNTMSILFPQSLKISCNVRKLEFPLYSSQMQRGSKICRRTQNLALETTYLSRASERQYAHFHSLRAILSHLWHQNVWIVLLLFRPSLRQMDMKSSRMGRCSPKDHLFQDIVGDQEIRSDLETMILGLM